MAKLIVEKHDPRWDARTLADAELINADPSRLAAAQSAAGEMLKDSEIEAAALKGITRKVYDHDTSVAVREKRETATSES